jgi:hypothetical protein
MMLEVRAFLNEGGRLLYTGRHAGWQFANAFDYNPVSTPPLCDAVDLEANDGCLFLSDDFLQYWLGAYLFVEDGGTDRGDPATTDDDTAFPVVGTDDPFVGATSSPWTINQTFAAGRDATTQSFITTSSILKAGTYPQFTSTAPGEWVTGIAGPYEPFSPTHYVYSQRADVRYQRLMKSFTVGGDNQFSFQVSYDTEPEWDFVFVELQDEDGNWVTLPEVNGNTQGGTPESTGQSCPEGWFELHPWLEQYEGTGCTGEGWNAASGRSAGWTEWEFDLGAYAGQDVTVSISYVSDWAIQGLGVWVDDVQVPGAPLTDFENGLDGWTFGDPTQIGSDFNALDWTLATDVGFTEGAMTSMTPADADFRTLYFGFGFENVAGTDERNEMMDLALDYLT